MPCKEQWARASSIGYYAACTYRAAWDRAIKEGLSEDTPSSRQRKDGPAPYADLGTCIHWFMQTRMGCIWPEGKEAKEFKYTKEQFDCAATLFNSNSDRLKKAMRASSDLAIEHMPDAPDGKPWLAETHAKDDLVSGHIDFLSQDGTTIVDLKTTSREPKNRRIKPAHMFQLCTYKYLVPSVERLYVLYVSSKGEWVLPPEPFDFTSKEGKEISAHALSILEFINSDHLYQMAWPSLTGCSENFCPYIEDCHDLYTPVQGERAKPVQKMVTAGFNVKEFLK